jgi:hypothetical protein
MKRREFMALIGRDCGLAAAGSIDVDTEPGQFTEFKIVLPRTDQK